MCKSKTSNTCEAHLFMCVCVCLRACLLQFLVGIGLSTIFWATGVVKRPKLDAQTVSSRHCSC